MLLDKPGSNSVAFDWFDLLSTAALRGDVAGWVSGSPPKLKEIQQEKMASSCVEGGLGWILGKMSSLKELSALEQATWGSGWVTIPGVT